MRAKIFNSNANILYSIQPSALHFTAVGVQMCMGPYALVPCCYYALPVNIASVLPPAAELRMRADFCTM